MIEVRLMTISRSAPATSTPRLKALFTTARKVKRNRAAAKEPSVRSRRIFFRNRLANSRLRYFMLRLRRLDRGARLPPGRLYLDVGECGLARLRRDHASPLGWSCDIRWRGALVDPGFHRRFCDRGRPWVRGRVGMWDRL